MDAAEYNYVHFDAYVEQGGEQDEFGAFANRLHAGERAPGFEVVRLDDGAVLDVADLWRRRDVVMEFGSFT